MSIEKLKNKIKSYATENNLTRLQICLVSIFTKVICLFSNYYMLGRGGAYGKRTRYYSI